MKSFSGIRYMAKSLKTGEKFPFGDLETLQELSFEDPISIIGSSEKWSNIGRITEAFLPEINSGKNGSINLDAFQRFSQNLIPQVLDAMTDLEKCEAGYLFIEKIALLGEAGETIDRVFSRASDSMFCSTNDVVTAFLKSSGLSPETMDILWPTIDQKALVHRLKDSGFVSQVEVADKFLILMKDNEDAS